MFCVAMPPVSMNKRDSMKIDDSNQNDSGISPSYSGDSGGSNHGSPLSLVSSDNSKSPATTRPHEIKPAFVVEDRQSPFTVSNRQPVYLDNEQQAPYAQTDRESPYATSDRMSPYTVNERQSPVITTDRSVTFAVGESQTICSYPQRQSPLPIDERRSNSSTQRLQLSVRRSASSTPPHGANWPAKFRRTSCMSPIGSMSDNERISPRHLVLDDSGSSSPTWFSDPGLLSPQQQRMQPLKHLEKVLKLQKRKETLAEKKTIPTSERNSDKFGVHCPLCSYSSHSRISFNEHLKIHANPLFCKMCGNMTDTKEEMVEHFYEAHEIVITSSEVPDPELIREDPALRIPKITASGQTKTYKCKNCANLAITKVEFWEHAQCHIKHERILRCPLCPFISEFKHHLEYHLRNHFSSKPFKCDQCEYACVNKSMLNSHLKSHSDVYQFSCLDCTYLTKYCHSLKLHLRKYDHRPAPLRKPDGTEENVIVDVYGNKRGPRRKNSSQPPAKKLAIEKKNGRASKKGPSLLADGVSTQFQQNTPFSPITQYQTNYAVFPPSQMPFPFPLLPNSNPFPSPSLLHFDASERKDEAHRSVEGLERLNQLYLINSMACMNNMTNINLNNMRVNSLQSANISGNQSSGMSIEENDRSFHNAQIPSLSQKLEVTGRSLSSASCTEVNEGAPLDLSRTEPISMIVAKQDLAKKPSSKNRRKGKAVHRVPVVAVYSDESDYDRKSPKMYASPPNLQESSKIESPQETLQFAEIKTELPSASLVTAPAQKVEFQSDLKNQFSFEESSKSNTEIPNVGAYNFPNNKMDFFMALLQNPAEISQLAKTELLTNIIRDKFSQQLVKREIEQEAERKEFAQSPKYSQNRCSSYINLNEMTNSETAGSSETKIDFKSCKKTIKSSNMDLVCSQTPPDWLSANGGRTFHCVFCDMNFKNEAMHTMHMGSHSYKHPFTCNMCGQATSDRISFFLHISRSSHNRSESDSSECDRPSSPPLVTPSSISFTCIHCDIIFGDLIMYQMHMGFHDRNNPFACNMCGERNKDAVNFSVHIARVPHF